MMPFMTLEEAKVKLLSLEADPNMNTISRYSPTATESSDHKKPFSEIHMAYLTKNKLVNPAHYITNLELMIKIPSA